jgi:hypothetical protein
MLTDIVCASPKQDCSPDKQQQDPGYIYEYLAHCSPYSIMIDGVMRWCGADVCDRLGHLDHSQAFIRHCRGVPKSYTLMTAGGPQKMRLTAERSSRHTPWPTVAAQSPKPKGVGLNPTPSKPVDPTTGGLATPPCHGMPAAQPIQGEEERCGGQRSVTRLRGPAAKGRPKPRPRNQGRCSTHGGGGEAPTGETAPLNPTAGSGSAGFSPLSAKS